VTFNEINGLKTLSIKSHFSVPRNPIFADMQQNIKVFEALFTILSFWSSLPSCATNNISCSPIDH
jgi:hypothetical protein